MQFDAETIGLLLMSFTVVVICSLAVIITLWIKRKRNAYAWFLAQIVLLIAAFFTFMVMLARTSGKNSLPLWITAVLWAASMVCMLIGISSLSKEKIKDEELIREKEEYNPTLIKVLGMLVVYILLCPLIPLIALAIAAKYIGFSMEDPLVYVIATVGELGFLLLWLRRKYLLNLKSMFSTKKFLMLFFIPMTLTIFGSGILLSEVDNFVTRIFPVSDFWIKTFSSLLGYNSAPWKGILAAVVIAPIVEEILFRGLILRGLLKHYSVRKSIIISALLFGIVHMNPWQFVSAFAGGLILGWWYVKTDSIVTTIFGHALNNSMSFIIGAIGLSIPGYNSAYGAVNHQPVWFDLLGIILLSGGIMWLVKLFSSRKASAGAVSASVEESNF